MSQIQIDGLIGWDVTAREVRRALAAAGSDAELVINSPGGDVHEGFAIFNAIRDYKRNGGQVSATISGIAASMATYISTAADSIAVEDNAVYMVHNPWTLALGDHRDMRKASDVLASLTDVLSRAYVARTGMDADAIRGEMDEETWLFGAEIVERGYADSVVPAGDGAETRDEAMGMAQASFRSMRAKLKEAEAENTLDRIAAMLPRQSAAGAAKPKEGHMPDPKQETAPAAAQEQPDNVHQIAERAKAEAMAALKARNDALRQRFDAFKAANPGRADDIRACFDDAMADAEQTPEQFTDAVLAKLAEAAQPVAGAHNTRVEGMMDERDKFRSGVSAVLAHRMGHGKDDRSNEYRGKTLADIAALSMQMHGADVSRLTRNDIASRIMAAHTTSDFPYLLADAANKSLQAAYGAFPSTWSAIAAEGSVSDFKTINLVRLGSFASLTTKLEGEEYQAGTFGEEREQLTAATKGRFIQMTREMIINDDLGGFARMASMLGRAAARTVNSDVYSVINTNGNLSNGRAIFNTTDGNKASSNGAISVSTLSAARAAMRKQQDPSGHDYLNIMPRTLLVPVALEDHARTVVSSDYDTDTAASRKRNPIRNWTPLDVVSDPYLDGTSTTAWYLVADPMDVPLLEVRFLDGNSTPFVDDTEEFMTDAIRWKVRLDYGVAANDRRGGYMNAGA